jgi:hypothetical protein
LYEEWTLACGIYLHQFKITFGVAPSGSGWGSHVNVGTVWKVVLIEAFVAEGTLAVPALEIFAVLVPAAGKIHLVCAWMSFKTKLTEKNSIFFK